MNIENRRLAAMVCETLEKEPLGRLAEKTAHCATDAENPRARRVVDPFENRAIEHAFIPRGSAIRVVQRVRDITDGSERDLYIAAIYSSALAASKRRLRNHDSRRRRRGFR